MGGGGGQEPRTAAPSTRVEARAVGGGGLGARCASAKAAEEREGTGESGWAGAAAGGGLLRGGREGGEQRGDVKDGTTSEAASWPYRGARGPPLAEP